MDQNKSNQDFQSQTQGQRVGQTGERASGSQDKFANTDRDESNLGRTDQREATQPGLANEDQPSWRPPETQPEPRPAEPILNQPSNSSQNTNTNSPA